ncbi:hypothetical protein D3C81_1358580 [compost metagenome]
MLLPVAVEQLLQKQGNIVAALAQGRRLDGEYVEAIVEIFAKTLGADHRLQIPVGRRYDTHIGLDGLAATDPVEQSLLQHPQQLDLHRQRHVTDLVEEQGTPLGQLEAAATGGDGAGEGPFLVAEQLALQELRRNGAAVDGHEGAGAAGRELVDGAGHHLLAGPGLSQDQHVGVCLCHLADEAAHLLDPPPLAHQQSQQGLALVVHLLTGMEGDEGLTEV